MLCERCGSERVNYERDATLIATALRVEGDTLILDSAPAAQGHEDVHLCCFDCGAKQHGVQWEDERPEHAPTTDMVIDAEDALDRIAAHVNEPGECQGADFVEFVSQLLPRTGRAVVDSDV
jgi:hypothetical protein